MNSFKINVIPTILAVAIAALSSYGFYVCCDSEECKTVVAIGGFVMLFASLFGMMGFTYEKTKNQSLVRVVSSLFLLVALISNIVFCSVSFAMPAYIIINGMLTLAYVLTVYLLDKASI